MSFQFLKMSTHSEEERLLEQAIAYSHGTLHQNPLPDDEVRANIMKYLDGEYPSNIPSLKIRQCADENSFCIQYGHHLFIYGPKTNFQAVIILIKFNIMRALINVDTLRKELTEVYSLREKISALPRSDVNGLAKGICDSHITTLTKNLKDSEHNLHSLVKLSATLDVRSGIPSDLYEGCIKLLTN